MNTQSFFATEIASQRAAAFIAHADHARLIKSLRKSAKRGQAARTQSAGVSSTVLRTS